MAFDFEWARATIYNRLVDLELEQWDTKEWGDKAAYKEAQYAFIVLKNVARKAGFDIDESDVRRTAMKIQAKGEK